MSEAARQLTRLRRRRGVTRSSITRLDKRLTELEEAPDRPTTVEHAQELIKKLEALDAEFKEIHFETVDVIDEDSEEREQEVLDDHDDQICNLNIRLKQLRPPEGTPGPFSDDPLKFFTRKLNHINKGLTTIRDAITGIPATAEDPSLVEQYELQLTDYKAELSQVHSSMMSVEDQDRIEDPLALHTRLQSTLFECIHLVGKLLKRFRRTDVAPSTISSTEGTGVRLPKLAVPTFDGDILNWRQFWEQFCISIHDRTTLSDAEKLVYLQHALKAGSAKPIIDGLSQSGEQYNEAIECLVARFDRPRVLHQTHVKMLMDTPPIREGSGRELRRLHDTSQQHLRALKAMGQEPSSSFITSLIELKLDSTTMFEWQRHSQDQIEVPHYKELLEFLDHRAQASEVSAPLKGRTKHGESNAKRQSVNPSKSVTSLPVNCDSTSNHCVLCKREKHPLFVCSQFRSLPHEEKLSVVRANNICINCLGKGHYSAQCKSVHRCHHCQSPHHTLLHREQTQPKSSASIPRESQPVSANASTISSRVHHQSLLMTCEVMIVAPSGTRLKARALLDSGSSASFVSERLSQSLRLERSKRKISVSGIGGASPNIDIKSVARFKICSTNESNSSMEITALVVPRVISDLPATPLPTNEIWSHLSGIQLADPSFHSPGRVDLLLGVEVFTEILLKGRRNGPPGTPTAIQTKFGWILCGSVKSLVSCPAVATVCHTLVDMSDTTLHKFWELEEPPTHPNHELSQKERTAVQYFENNHTRTPDGHFMVPLPRESGNLSIGESRSQAVRRFLSIERSLTNKNRFEELDAVIQEYFELTHAEPVPVEDLQKPVHEVFYLPIHAVYKQSSTTTKVRAVFDASAKSVSGVSLNDTLLNGPTVHPPLIDVLMRFRLYPYAITADVSKMYRAVKLVPNDKDFHRFVWRSKTTDQLKDFRMTRVTFGVSASSFVANMAVKQNAIDFERDLPLAAKAVENNIYVDDCLTGATSITEAVNLHHQLLELFGRGGFLLRKWNASDPEVLRQIEPSLRDAAPVLSISGGIEYAKTLGLEWNTTNDHFRITITDLPSPEILTKRILVSNVAKVFDVLGWLSPTVIKMKILLQRLWEASLDWDDPIPNSIKDVWLKWNTELSILSNCHVPRYPFSKNADIINVQLHGFADASEDAYAAVVYIRGEDTSGQFHVGLIMAKTKVSPLKRLTIPRLELCGAYLLARVMKHIKDIYCIPSPKIHAWTDSTIVLNWLRCSSRRFKTFVGNRVSSIIDMIPPSRWSHVPSGQNPADCASRGIYPQELYDHGLWWKGPEWLSLSETHWPKIISLPANDSSIDEGELCMTVIQREPLDPVISFDRYSEYSKFKRVTAWIRRFVTNCRKKEDKIDSPSLSVKELSWAENYWITVSQSESFSRELTPLKRGCNLPNDSKLKFLRPFLDSNGVIRVGGRISNSTAHYSQIHPIVLHGNHSITRLIVQAEHRRMLHASPSLLCASISLKFHIIRLRGIVRTITRNCSICRRYSGKVLSQQQGQLPQSRLTPGLVFEKVGLDFAGPFNVKYGHVRKPTIVKAYICLFVSFTVKAVHLEVVSDLTTEAFIASLHRFISRRGLPTHIWSDHGTNFVGAKRELIELYNFLKNRSTNSIITEFCSQRGIDWSFIPERAPHFGGLWESAVKSMKYHLRRITSDVRLTFEELQTVVCQIEACLNSRPLIPLNHVNDRVSEEVLTPAHFLIGRSLATLPDQSVEEKRPISILRRWELCQNIVHHFWRRWSTEYISSLNKYSKWPNTSPNIAIGDIVVLKDESLFPTRWPLGRVVAVHPGKDELVRVVTIRTSKGTYKRPITKLVVLPTNSRD